MENKTYNYSNFCGLFGYPVKHSLSPLMHNLSFEHHSIDWIYLVFEVNPGEFEKAVEGMKVCGIRGFNVTMPFKEKIIEFLDDVDGEVEKMGAVNTVNILDGKMTGYNTDHRGFYRSIQNYSADIKNESVIMFGAGGAAKAVLYSLLYKLEPDNILILDIAEEKINDLKKRVDGWGISQKNVLFDLTGHVPDIEDKIKSAKLIINASPIGMTQNINGSVITDENLIHDRHIIYDLVYSPIETRLLKMARNKGAAALGGLDMLIYQGAEAFTIWTGKEMPVDKVREKLKIHFSS